MPNPFSSFTHLLRSEAAKTCIFTCALLLGILTLLLLPAPSQAGTWNITFTGNTTATYAPWHLANNGSGGGYPWSDGNWYLRGNYTFVNSVMTGPYPTGSYTDFSMSGPQSQNSATFTVGSPYPASAYAGSSTLSVTATLTWMPSFAGDLPPATVNVVETAKAQYGNMYLGEPLQYATRYHDAVNADDGLGDASTVLSSFLNPPSLFMTLGSMSTGKHLVQLTIAPGQASMSLPLRSLAASMTSDLPGHFGTPMTSRLLSYTVAIDNRAVGISADVGTTYYKLLTGGLDANGDALVAQMPHIPASDGTLKGDIGLDFGDSDPSNLYNNVGVTYTANLAGNWAANSSQYLWNTSLKNASYTGTLYGIPPSPGIQTVTNVYRRPYILDETKTPQIIVPNDVGSQAVDSAQVDHLFFKYQNGDNRPSPWTPYVTGNDGDGTIATTNYYLSLHQANEVMPSNKHGIIQPGEGQENIIYKDAVLDIKSSPPFATFGNGVQCEWNDPGPFWGIGEQATSVLSNAPWPNKWVGAAVGLAGLLASDFGPHPDSAIINFDSDTWNAAPATQFPTDHAKGKYPMVDYNMTPGQHIRYLRHYQLKDTYDMKGFEGESMVSYDTFAGKGPSFGTFTWAPPH